MHIFHTLQLLCELVSRGLLLGGLRNTTVAGLDDGDFPRDATFPTLHILPRNLELVLACDNNGLDFTTSRLWREDHVGDFVGETKDDGLCLELAVRVDLVAPDVMLDCKSVILRRIQGLSTRCVSRTHPPRSEASQIPSPVW